MVFLVVNDASKWVVYNTALDYSDDVVVGGGVRIIVVDCLVAGG